MPQPLVRYIDVVVPTGSISKRVLAQMQLENAGVHGPFLIHGVQPQLLAALWALFRETQLASGVARVDQESIALLVAQENRCPWCIEAHQLALHRQPASVAMAAWYLASPDPLQHSQITGLNNQAMVAHRAAVVLWQYINRMTNVLLVESAWQNLGPWRKPMTQVMGQVFGLLFLQRRYTPGRALEFIADAPLPAHLAWASEHQYIAKALAYFHQQVNQAIKGIIPDQVQSFVLHYLQKHRGQPVSLSRRWSNDAVQLLEPEQRTLAQVLLLIALASYQIDDDLMLQLRRTVASDADIVAVLAWGSYAIFNRNTLV
jgi:AhpD family alkylhydroperoxidase